LKKYKKYNKEFKTRIKNAELHKKDGLHGLVHAVHIHISDGNGNPRF
jgi:hypothetical protein